MSVTGNIVNAGAVNIAGFTSDSEKSAVVAADKIVIIDSEDSDQLKTAQVGNIPGSGDVTGPSSSVDNAVTRYDSTSGKLIQGSLATLSDTGTFNIPAGQTYNVNGSPVGVGDVVGPASATDNAITRFDSTTGKLVQNSTVTVSDAGTINIPSGQTYNINGTPIVQGKVTDNIQFIIDGGGFAITTGIKFDIVVPFAGTITSATALADQSGSIAIDLWKDSYANYPPTVADTIVAAAPVTISAATKSQDSTLTGWTTAVTAGDIIRINVNSCATITRCLVALAITKS